MRFAEFSRKFPVLCSVPFLITYGYYFNKLYVFYNHVPPAYNINKGYIINGKTPPTDGMPAAYRLSEYRLP